MLPQNVRPHNKHSLLKRPSGFSLIELMVVVAIVGVISSIAPQFMTSITRFIRINNARIEIQRDARTTLEVINRKLRQARASSIVLTRESASQPPYSKLQFTTIKDEQYDFYQVNDELFMGVSGSPKKIAENLKFISFSYPRSDDANIISVSVTFEKGTVQGGSKALQMAIEKIRIMN